MQFLSANIGSVFYWFKPLDECFWIPCEQLWLSFFESLSAADFLCVWQIFIRLIFQFKNDIKCVSNWLIFLYTYNVVTTHCQDVKVNACLLLMEEAIAATVTLIVQNYIMKIYFLWKTTGELCMHIFTFSCIPSLHHSSLPVCRLSMFLHMNSQPFLFYMLHTLLK